MNTINEETATKPFSEQVKWVRGELLLTQAEMAREIGITPSTLSRWENSSREPSFLGKKQFVQFCKKKGSSPWGINHFRVKANGKGSRGVTLGGRSES